MNYEDAVAYMSGLLQFGIRLDRERFVALLARLGDPHRRLRCIHVAGTNGKGSTTTFIASILRAAGYRTGTYLSPYVFDLRERIQVDGKMIPRAHFAHWVSTIRPEIEWIMHHTDLGETTEFELKTAVAFCYFAEQALDFAVIEVGLGGRLDATNIIDPPLVAVITNIGLDHMQILGDTLAKIAREKAGILKTGTFCVTGVAAGEARDTIVEIAAEREVPLRVVEATSGDDLPSLALRGPFQIANAHLAIAAIDVLRDRHQIPITDQAVRDGLATATLPARFQIIRNGDPALVLDVAHNEDGAGVVAAALRESFPNRRFAFVVGMTRNHEPESFLSALAPLISRLVVTAPTFRPKPVAETAAAATALGIETEVIEPASAAIQRTWDAALPGDVVVVTGSFYVVGETPDALRGSQTLTERE